MKSRTTIFFLIFILLLASFAPGIAAADAQSDDPGSLTEYINTQYGNLLTVAADVSADPAFDSFFNNNNKQLLGYNETIYINGDMVTIVNNYASTGFPVRQFNGVNYAASNPVFSKFHYNKQKNVIQFNVSELGLMENGESVADFSLHLCGNIDGNFSNNHVDQKIQFRAEKIFESPTVEAESSFDAQNFGEAENFGEDDAAAPAYKIIVYPIQSGLTHDFGIPVYYIHNYGSVFSDEAVFPDFKAELLDSNVIYSFEPGTVLRSVYWYDAKASGVRLKADDSVEPYEPEFMFNLSDLQDFDLNVNSLFICPEHDNYTVSDYSNSKKTLIIPGVPYSHCSADIRWGITIGDSEMDASNYLVTYEELYPIEESEEAESDEDDGQVSVYLMNDLSNEPTENEAEDEIGTAYPHFISFDSSALRGHLLKEHTVSVQFYPMILDLEDESNKGPKDKVVMDNGQKAEAIMDNTDEELQNEDEPNDSFISYRNSAYSFIFKRLSQSLSINFDADGLFDLVTPQHDVKKPLLSSMIFPSSIQEKLAQNSLVLTNLNPDVFNDIDNSIAPETEVLSVIDIGFENNGSEINDLLKENNQHVTMVFSIPRVIDGENVDPKKLEVLHIMNVDGTNKVELLTIDSAEPGEINGIKCYYITISTSGFSPFAIVSSDTPIPPQDPEIVSESDVSSFGEAAIVLQTEPADTPSIAYSGETPLTVISEIITTVQGYLSLFSILVVLISGMFMWDYIRRRIKV